MQVEFTFMGEVAVETPPPKRSPSRCNAGILPAYAWPDDFPNVITLSNVVRMKESLNYEAAKAGDTKAAVEVMKWIIGKTQKQKIVDLTTKHPDAIVCAVVASEQSGKNAIPVMLRKAVAKIGNLRQDTEIVQANEVGHTGKGVIDRIAFRSQFTGDVENGAEYVLVDDVVTSGATLGDLRDHIESNGGNVVAMMSIGAAQFGANIRLSIKTKQKLEEKYGKQQLCDFLKEFNIHGGIHEALTEFEARAILSWPSLDDGRDRIIAASEQVGGGGRGDGSGTGGAFCEFVNGVPPDVFAVFEKVKKGRPLNPQDFDVLTQNMEAQKVKNLASMLCDRMAARAKTGGRLRAHEVDFFRSVRPGESGGGAVKYYAPKTDADRQRDMGSRDAELKPFFHDVVNPERKERCRLDLVQFVLDYLTGDFPGAIFDHEPSEDIITYLRALQGAILTGGMILVVMPRGAGKTAGKKAAVAWAGLYGHRKFPVTICANERGARKLLRELWNVFERNECVFEDFPEIAIPVRKMAGQSQRLASMTYDSERIMMSKTTNEIILPTIPGAPCSGVALVCFGLSGGFKGLVIGNTRPDLVLLDDLQTRETAKSEALTTEIEEKIQGDIMGLAGHRRRITILMSVTPIEPYDLCDRYLDKTAHPEWEIITFPFVKAWPKATELWNEYIEIHQRDTASGNREFTNATAFYEENREEMDEGAETIDPLNFDPETERSSIHHAYALLAERGKKAFMAEYQLAPERPSATLEITQKHVSACVSGMPALTLPEGFYAAVAYVDCMNKEGLRWMILGIGSQRRATIIGYGRHPEKEDLYPKTATIYERKRAFAMRLKELMFKLRDTKIKLHGGGTIGVGVIGVDRRWVAGGGSKGEKNIVDLICKNADLRGIAQAVSGTPTEKFMPTRANGERMPGVIMQGDGCYEYHAKNGNRFLASHSNYWKEYAQLCFLQYTPDVLLPGSVCFWGDDPYFHHAAAAEITAQQLVLKEPDKDGKMVWKWKTRVVGAADHYLDCLAQCFMLASWKRYFDSQAVTASGVAAQPAPQRRVKKVRQCRIVFKSEK